MHVLDAPVPVCLFVCLSVCLYVCLFVCLCFFVSSSRSPYSSSSAAASQSVCLSVSLCLFVSQLCYFEHVSFMDSRLALTLVVSAREAMYKPNNDVVCGTGSFRKMRFTIQCLPIGMGCGKWVIISPKSNRTRMLRHIFIITLPFPSYPPFLLIPVRTWTADYLSLRVCL